VRYAEFAPSPRLAPHVRCFWTFQSDALPAGAAAETIAPDGSPELIFHLGDVYQRVDATGRVVTQHRTVFVGQIDRAMVVRPTGRASIFAVRFRPAGAAAFFRGPARALAGLSTPLDALWPRDAVELTERIAEAPDDDARVAAVERMLERRLAPPRAALLAAAAERRIAAAGGALRMDELADELGASPRTIERAFDDAVGVAPKTLARIIRFRRALGALESPRRTSFVDVALSCGYADQSHLVRDFRAFTGGPPTAYLDGSRPMADHFSADL
jgi:AraC-like DNA-binding protein